MKKLLLEGIIPFILTMLIGCRETELYFNKPFDEIHALAYANDKPFCIVLTDTVNHMSRQYHSLLDGDYRYLARKALFDIVDITVPDNEWYIKWLNPTFIPVTCVFLPSGQLVDIIPGASRESFLYTEKSLKYKSATEFHWPNSFKINKERVVPLLNRVLFHKQQVEHGMLMEMEINSLIDSLHYPYIVYQKLAGQLMQNDSIPAKKTALDLVEFEEPYYLELYQNEIITAKRVIDPHFRIEEEANIRIDKEIFDFGECVLNESIPIEIKTYNEGLKPLRISKIMTSCTCVKNLNQDEIIIPSKGSIKLDFIFIPDVEGEIKRDIYIASNSIESPILHIEISAKTITNN